MKKLFALILASLFLVAMPVQAQQEPGTATGVLLPDFTTLVGKYGGAVVNISSTQSGRDRTNAQNPFDEDDPMYDFFRRFVPPHRSYPPREYESRSMGSGFIISEDGYVLTNTHVVDAADEITVRLTDKREFRAKLIGIDRRTDVALLKIEAKSLPTVKLGNVDDIRVGEWVVAIGSPFGFENSVTSGIVSAKGRALPQENYVPFIQTDVAINPGNSGGPLFNMKGEVIGINSQIYSRSGGFMGISFAIPIDVAMEVQDQLRAHGKVSRGRIGVIIQEVTRDLADSFGLGKPAGALVSSVEPGGPAEKAGLEPGDVILKFNGRDVDSSGDLPRIVGSIRPGTQVQIQIWRRGTIKDLPVVVAEMKDEQLDTARGGKAPRAQEQATNRLGLVLSELTAEQRKEMKIDGGLLVEEVRGNGVRADLRTGDIIVAIVEKGNSTDLKSVAQFNKILAAMDKNTTVTLLVRRGEVQTFMTIKLPGKN